MGMGTQTSVPISNNLKLNKPQNTKHSPYLWPAHRPATFTRSTHRAPSTIVWLCSNVASCKLHLYHACVCVYVCLYVCLLAKTARKIPVVVASSHLLMLAVASSCAAGCTLHVRRGEDKQLLRPERAASQMQLS